jgi:hypothetical protein
MKTSTADAYQYICQMCQDTLTLDRAGKGFVRHMHNPNCPNERGERDLYGPHSPHGNPGSMN